MNLRCVFFLNAFILMSGILFAQVSNNQGQDNNDSNDGNQPASPPKTTPPPSTKPKYQTPSNTQKKNKGPAIKQGPGAPKVYDGKIKQGAGKVYQGGGKVYQGSVVTDPNQERDRLRRMKERQIHGKRGGGFKRYVISDGDGPAFYPGEMAEYPWKDVFFTLVKIPDDAFSNAKKSQKPFLLYLYNTQPADGKFDLLRHYELHLLGDKKIKKYLKENYSMLRSDTETPFLPLKIKKGEKQKTPEIKDLKINIKKLKKLRGRTFPGMDVPAYTEHAGLYICSCDGSVYYKIQTKITKDDFLKKLKSAKKKNEKALEKEEIK